MLKINGVKLKKGFSLMEVVIAMAVISIVFTVAMTSIAATGKARLRSFQVKYCVTETANLLECYKLDGGENFENNVSTYLGLEISGKPKNDEGGAYVEYTIYYGSKFEKLSNDNAEDEEKRVYCLIAKLYSDGFATKVININSDSVIFETQKYQSRFDIQGGLV